MNKILTYIFGVFIGLNSLAQVTVEVNELPENTPENSSIFISGDFEGWSGGQENYKLTKEGHSYYITIPQKETNINFKFTQGSWDSVECDSKGNSTGNRSYNFNKPNDTLKVKIEGWSNLFDKKATSTAAGNVSILSEKFKMPQLNRERRIWIYLPPDYDSSKQSYPVVYMHDGQNLFDVLTSYSGEWEIDETLNKLYQERGLKLIVVGVDNGGAKRLDEYSPWKNTKYGGGEGDAYMDFLVSTLKPYIDSHFRTLPDKANTGIIGSSMGGLISHYAALKYPEVFGKIGVFSPAFWFAPEITEYSRTHGNIKDTKIYFLAGGKEGENVAFNEINQTVKDMNTMAGVLKKEGFPLENMKLKVEPEGQHNEKLWRNNFEETICWLFSDKIKHREYKSAYVKDNELHVDVTDGKYLIKFYNSKIVETTFIPQGETFNANSHAVVLVPNQKEVKFTEVDNSLTFSAEDFTVQITKKPFGISYWYQGNEVISERNGYQKNNTYETIQFGITQDEILYGGGARALGMNRRGYRLELYNKAHYGYETHSELMNFTLPIVLSSKRYLLHFDNAPIGFLDLDSKQDNTVTYETISGRKTYQVVVGNSWYNLINNYTNLTGKQPMLPRWALGNFSSRFGYHSQEETVATINKFREEQIPVDAIILDLYWFGKDIKGTMGNLEFYKDSFPNPEQMIKTLHDKKVETVLITEPFILTTSNRWDEAVSKDILAKDSLGNAYTFDFYFGHTGLIDIYSQKGKNWFKNIYKALLTKGVKGMWGDLGEPEVHPHNLIHATGTADEVHNIYGHDWAGLVKESYEEYNPNIRPFILMRAGYSGSQRYSMVPWSGDVNRTWGGLQSQPEIALQMGMQGLGYMHSDLGGFAGANLDDELYARWLQYGVFQPIYRPHAQEEVASEPIFRSEKAKSLAKKAIELRYQMLPYNYNLVFENHIKGTPLMRPLFFDDCTKDALYEDANLYLWGNDFLVAPVTISKEEKKTIYFPKTSNWFDFYSDKKYKAGSITFYSLEEDKIPTFVRGGSFIPMAKPMQSTKEYNGNELILHYYFDDEVEGSKYQTYNDDGLTANAYEKGEYELMEFEAEQEGNILEVELEAKMGSHYQTSVKTITLVIHNMDEPVKVKHNKKKQKFNYNNANRTLTIPLEWNTKDKLELNIKLSKK